jgi:iron complex outermembrane receptor protein
MPKLFPNRRRKALALAMAALPWAASAQDLTSLPPVEVTAPALAGFDGSNVTAETLRSATERDTARLLTEIPGVSVNPAGGISALPAIHGLADDRLRVSVDGVDLVASCPNHMNSPLSYVDPAQIAAVRVFAGLAPVSSGGDAIGGVIQVETRSPEFAPPGETLAKGRVGMSLRSNDNARALSASATLASDALSLNYAGAASQADNYTAGGDFKTSAATGNAGHTLPLDEVGSTAYKAVNHQLGLGWRSGEHLLEARFAFQDVPYQLYPNQRMDMLDNTERRMTLRYLGAFAWGSLEARAWRETVDHFMNFGADKQFWYPNAAPGMPMYTRSRNTGGALKASVDLSEQDLLRVGAELHRYRLDDWWPPSGTGGMSPDTFLNINDGKRDRSALFGEWEKRPDARWLTLLGARYEQVKTDAGAVDAYSTSIPADQANFNARDRARTDHNWDLTALARYTADTTRSVEFGYARKTRSPNLYERYSWRTRAMEMVMNNFVGDGNGYVGDPDLKPEKAHTVSATFDWHAADRAWEFKATPYYTRVTDYIDAVRCTVANTFSGSNCPATNTSTTAFVQLQYANQAARLYGVDFSGKAPLAHNAFGDWGATGLLAYTKGKNLDTGDELYNIMPLHAKLALTQKLGRWDNAVEVIAVARKNAVSDVRNEIRTPGYGLVNLRASHAWKQARLDFGVENLFDKLYFLPTGGAYVGQGMTMSINGIPWGIAVPGMGRSFYAGLTLDF